jgi:uncharacterized protein (TIGR02145 family)
VWMAENLRVTHYRNGDAILKISDNNEWTQARSGAYSDCDDNEQIIELFGRFYNWFAVVDNRGLAPAGWHIPSDAEWQRLVDYLGGESVAGGKMKKPGTEYWRTPNIGATNESGFSAQPAGDRSYWDGYCTVRGFDTNF